MSHVVATLGTVFTSNAGRLRADFGAMQGGMRQFSSATQGASRQSGLLNQQLRAIGTTLRYAFAGTAVYGIASMVSQLSQLQVQLGLIAAIGGAGREGLTGSRSLSGFLGGLDKMQTQLMDLSVSTLVPIGDLNDAVVNLLSTVGTLAPDKISPIIEQLAKTATLTQTPIQDITKAMTTMNVAFGRTPDIKNIKSISDEFFLMIQRAPGGTAAASQIINQMGGLAASARLANVKPSQMMAMLTSVLQFGIPPQQGAQGLRFLLNTIATPSKNVKESAAAFKSMGITEEFVQQQGGAAALLKVLRHVHSLGIKGNLAEAQKRLKATSPDTPVDEDLIADLGISGAGARELGTLFRRQHALRTAVALYARLYAPLSKQDPNLVQNLKDMAEQANLHGKKISELDAAWKRFSDRTQLARAAKAIDRMQLQVAKIFEPVLNFAAGKVLDVNKLMVKHPDATKAVVFSVTAAIAALGLSRVLNVKGLLRGAGRGIGPGMAIKDQISGEDVLGGKPMHPMYVFVVNSLFPKGPGGAPVPPVVTGPGGKPVPVPGEKPVPVPGERPPGRVGRAGRGIGRGIGAAATIYTGRDLIENPPSAVERYSGRKVGALQAWGNLLQDITGGFLPTGMSPEDTKRQLIQKAKIEQRAKTQREKLDIPEASTGLMQKLLTESQQDFVKTPSGGLRVRDPKHLGKYPLVAQLARLNEMGKLNKAGQNFLRNALKAQWGDFELKRSEKRLEDHNQQLMKQLKSPTPIPLTGDIVITVQLDDGKSKQELRVHVDPSTFQGGKAPSTRGKSKTIKKSTTQKKTSVTVGPNPELGIP